MSADAHLPYMKRGIRDVPTTSSVPLSSSRYLNDVRMRDWTPVAMMRKAGADYPDGVEYDALERILDGLRDDARANALVRAAMPKDRLLAKRVAAPELT